MQYYTTTIDNVATKTPNFLIIGAAKSGTTALWHCLKQHPQIYMSRRKHTRFFAYQVEEPEFRGPSPENPSVPYAIANTGDYHALFEGVTVERAIGEASHSYLYRPQAAARIREYNSGMKLIAILRNPADRAYSHYRQMVRDGREPLVDDFLRALEEEDARIRDNWWPDFHYVRIGLYHAQLKRYFDLFKSDQIRVYLYEDFNSDPSKILQDIFRFLAVDDAFVPEATIKYNASGVPKNKVLHAFLQKLRRVRPLAEWFLAERHSRLLLRVGSSLHNRNLTRVGLSPDLRKRVINKYYREDILKLQQLIHRDLSGWIEK